MKRRVLLLALLGAVAPPLPAAQDQSRKPLAVLWYADWCYNCKLIVPKLEQARKGLEDRIRFIKLDFTDDKTKLGNRKLARDLGFYDLYLSNKATGWVTLLDADGKQVGELKQDMSVETLRAALEKHAQSHAASARAP